MKNIKTILYLFLSILPFHSKAQHEKCGTMEGWRHFIENNPNAIRMWEESENFTRYFVESNKELFSKTGNAERANRSVITIPVVVHVIHGGQEIGDGANISDAQVYSQIEVLNKDFRLMNSDSLPNNHPFWSLTSDCGIEFCLANQDPDGNPTSGIIRINSGKPFYTNAEADNNEMKFSALGGSDAWDATKYLNVWTYQRAPNSNSLGRAQFPEQLASNPLTDGVICIYNAFGTIGTDLLPVNSLGRTMTHEVGHWLGLRHIWGDGDATNVPFSCGDDLVDDTPSADSANYGCKVFPWKVGADCTDNPNGQMYMNYMDYCDDACLVAFTAGQAVRMLSALSGARNGILTSNGCEYPSSIIGIVSGRNISSINPNPSNGEFTLKFNDNISNEVTDISVFNHIGEKIVSFDDVNENNFRLDLKNYAQGMYYVRASFNGFIESHKVIITK